MPDNSRYTRIADNNISALKSKCLRGLYTEWMFRTVTRGLDTFYSLEKLEWMKEYFTHRNEHIAASCLECLCAHGYNLEDAMDVITSRVDDKVFSNKVIELAEKYDKPDVLLNFMDEGKGYVNKVILALKKMHHEEYMTTLMMSDNEMLVKSVNKLTNGI